MPFQSAAFDLTREVADPFGDALMDAGAISVNVEDAEEGTAAEKPIFGEPGAATGLWERCRLVALFQADADVASAVAQAAFALDIPAPLFMLEDVPDIDWVQSNRDQFQPIPISDRVWIVPTWHAAPDAAAVNIALDPGAAFGTGSHPTTRLCLQWLEAHLVPGDKPFVLDYGTGSGILAIAAMKLGAARAMGVDIDAQAVEAARYNAAQNGVDIAFDTTEHALEAVADITVANILANPLKVLAPLLASHTRPGGRLVLAGILDHQAEEIIAIYRDWFQLAVWRRDEGWSCIAGTRHA